MDEGRRVGGLDVTGFRLNLLKILLSVIGIDNSL